MQLIGQHRVLKYFIGW